MDIQKQNILQETKWFRIHKNHMTTPLPITEVPKPNHSKSMRTPSSVAAPNDNHHERMTWYLVLGSSIVFASL